MSETKSETLCVIYASKSSPDEKGSIPDQQRECREYATAQGWTVVDGTDDYWDEAKSAYKGNRGKGLAAAKARAARLAAEGQDVVLLVKQSDRLARGDGEVADHLLEVWFAAKRGGYRLVAVRGGLEDLLRAALEGERNHEDSRAKSEWTKVGIRRRIEDGYYQGGRAPYGFKWERDRNDKNDRGRLVAGPEARHVRRIFGEYLAGYGDRTIAESLSEDGVPSPKGGGAWDGSQIRNMLRCPTYAALVRVGDELRECAPGAIEPIIKRELWEEVQDLRAARRDLGAARGPTPVGKHLLRGGLLRDGACGGAMRPRTWRHRPGLESYVCATKDTGRGGRKKCSTPNVARADVDEPLLRHLEEAVFDLGATRAQLEAAHRHRLDEARCERDTAETEAQKAEDRLRRVRRDYADGRLDADDWRSFRDELTAELDGARAKLEQLRRREAEVEAETPVTDVEDEILLRLAELRAAVAGRIDSAEGIEALRAAIEATFEKIELWRDPEGGIILLPYLRLEAISNLREVDLLDDLPEPRRLPIPLQMGMDTTGRLRT